MTKRLPSTLRPVEPALPSKSFATRFPSAILGLAIVAGLVAATVNATETASTETNLFAVLRAGTASDVRQCLKRGVDLQARDAHGDTPLMAAALSSDVAVLESLLEAGADVNATNAAGATALMRAATMADKAQLLVLAGADVSARSVLGNTALILAARKPGNHPTVRLLLDRGAAVNATNVFGATALMAAAAADDLATVRLLLDHGAAIDAAPLMSGDGFIWGGGRTALQWAAFYGNEAILRHLLDRGAKVDQFTLAGGALAQAAWGGRVGAARMLLKAGAPVDQRDLVANYTPLHWAASSEHASPALVNVLLAGGADARAEGGQPVDNFLGAIETPLSLARKRGETPIVRALLKAGASDSGAVMPAPSSRREATASRNAARAEDALVVGSIRRALPALLETAERSARTFRRHASKQECISCHQQQLPLAALSLAHTRGFETDRTAVRRQLELMQSFMSSTPVEPGDPRLTALEMSLQATFHPEAAIFAGYASLPLHLEQIPASEAMDATVHQLAATQHPDGHWSWNLPRPPIQASDIAATALAVHTIRHFRIPARGAELDAARQRARTWLTNASAETGEEQAYQLLGLSWAGETGSSLARLAQGMIATQRADGGWGQLAGLESDAYATGQALYALLEGGHLPLGHPVVRRGVSFLLGNQQPDGTWHVRRRAHPFQPPMDSGFAHGADGWISSAGSSWAVMALATSLSLRPGIHRSEYARIAPVAPNEPSAGDGAPVVASGPGVETSGSDLAPVDFVRDIQPVLNRSCVGCHSGARPKGGYVVTDRVALLRGGARGEPAVVPGRPEASLLLHVVQDRVEDLEMPPLGQRGKYPALSREEIQRLRTWIRQGSRGAAEAARLEDSKGGSGQVVTR